MAMTALSALTIACLSAWSGSAHADGDVFAVLPTVGTGGVTLEAELATNVMRGALQEQSLALVPANTIRDAVAANALACQAPFVCARMIGEQTGATRVIASELWDQAGQFELRVAVVDTRSTADPTWQSYPAGDKAALSTVAEEAVLALAVPEAFKGTLFVTMAAGAEVLVDGVYRDTTPTAQAISLSVGRHEVEVRAGETKPFRDFVTIELGQQKKLSLCEKSGALVSVGCEEAAGGSMRNTLWTGGMIGAGAGAVVTAAGAVMLGLASGTLAAYQADKDNVTSGNVANATGMNAGGIAAVVAGGAILAVGAVTTGVSMVME